LPQYKTLQTTDRQTDRRQTTHCTKGSTDSTVGQKRHVHDVYGCHQRKLHLSDVSNKILAWYDLKTFSPPGPWMVPLGHPLLWG